MIVLHVKKVLVCTVYITNTNMAVTLAQQNVLKEVKIATCLAMLTTVAVAATVYKVIGCHEC